MSHDLPPTSLTDMLIDLAALGMRAARLVVGMMEIEQAAADIAAADLPKAGAIPASVTEATLIGLSLDQVTQLMAGAVPRIERLARVFERASRAVRRSVALKQRIEAGWPRIGRADDRAAMVQRQAARGTAEVIRRTSESDDTAERLFDDLADRLDDPWMEQALLDPPVDDVVRSIRGDLGVVADDLRALGGGEATAMADELDALRLRHATDDPPPD